MTQPPDDAALVARLRKRLVEAPAQPWAYRPDKYDDWGMIRGPVRDDMSIGPFRPIVARGHDSMVSEANMGAHRVAKTDPYCPSSLLIVDAVNALPGLLDALEAKDRQIEVLEAALAPFAKAGSIAGPSDPRWDFYAYRPAAGDEYAIMGNHLRAASAALEPSDKGVGR